MTTRLKLAILLLIGIGEGWCSMNSGRTVVRSRSAVAQSVVSGVYPVDSRSSVMPGIVIVKRMASPIKKSKGSSWEHKLQNVQAVSVKPMFHAHRHEGTRLSGIYLIRLSPGMDVYQACSILSEDPSVIWVEPAYERKVLYEPNDAEIDQQWYLEKVQARAAWDLRGASNTLIGVVDSGFNLDHPDLADNIWTNTNEIPNNGIDDDGNDYVDDVTGWDFGDEDNNPTYEQDPALDDNIRWHGTAVAGVASAVTDNGIGMASLAFNARIMPVKVMTQDGTIYTHITAYGIVYAADNGADIINVSLGGGSASNLEREAIAHACSLGVLVVASAGNDGTEDEVYPAAFREALSVAAVGMSDRKANFSSYGYTVDMSAPGVQMFTLNGQAGYSYPDGTSFSAPLVASIAALVMSVHPEWSGVQAGEQVRVSADPIDHLNPAYTDRLGYGRANAYRALTVQSPSIRLSEANLIEGAGSNQDGIFDPGEEVLLTLVMKNYLQPATNISLRITTDHPSVTIENSRLTIPSLSMLEEWQNTGNPVRLFILPSARRGQRINVFIEVTSGGTYQDLDHFHFIISPYTVCGGKVRLTISSNGRLGFWDYPANLVGEGFVFHGENLLFEGAVMAATQINRISDVARGSNQSSQNDDFSTAPGGDVIIRRPGAIADEQGRAVFNDDGAIRTNNLWISQTTLTFYDHPDDEYILMAYWIRNMSTSSYPSLYFGLFMDWDVGGDDFASVNQPGYDADLSLGYVYHDMTSRYAGLQVVSEGGADNYKSISNPGELYDGYHDYEKWTHLTGGIQPIAGTLPSDYSHVLGVGPLSLAPGDSVLVGFAVLGGFSEDALKDNAEIARDKWHELFETTTVEEEGNLVQWDFRLESNYPNPFNPSTTIGYRLAEASHVVLTIHNVQGREVVRLVDADQDEGHYTVQWNGTAEGVPLSSGVYVYRLRAGAYEEVRKMILLR